MDPSNNFEYNLKKNSAGLQCHVVHRIPNISEAQISSIFSQNRQHTELILLIASSDSLFDLFSDHKCQFFFKLHSLTIPTTIHFKSIDVLNS
jgi:hypothetical protein